MAKEWSIKTVSIKAKSVIKLGCRSYLFGFLSEEEAEYHQIGEWQEEVDVGVILVLLHKERRPAEIPTLPSYFNNTHTHTPV